MTLGTVATICQGNGPSFSLDLQGVSYKMKLGKFIYIYIYTVKGVYVFFEEYELSIYIYIYG